MGESRNAYRMLVGRPEGIMPLGMPRRIWEDNVKTDLRIGTDMMAGLCESSNEPPGSLKARLKSVEVLNYVLGCGVLELREVASYTSTINKFIICEEDNDKDDDDGGGGDGGGGDGDYHAEMFPRTKYLEVV
ncbi:hypothetical protein ANN_24594 [Periplaneta americana]|uniref:Uncharacterized protein n=1 Tax=Periplaneta americana TaxID=6978 RepID=A0ABQ8S476_PERAM|nr:hypothetical protein ANN_24594 [Periplaneta americana]